MTPPRLPDAPPARALRLLEGALPYARRDEVIGDLVEEWRGVASARPRLASLWFWRHALDVAARIWIDDLRSTRPSEERRTGDPMLETFWNDLRHGARRLMRAPTFTLVAVTTLAVGIGANTAIFSVVNATLVRPLPIPESGQLVQALGLDARGRTQYVSWPDFLDWKKETKLLDGLTGMVPQSVNLTGRDEPTRVRGGFVTGEFFDVIRTNAALGRAIVAADDAPGAERVCVLQYETWQKLFGGDPQILGRKLVLNNEPFTVVGVLAQGFRFPFDEVEVWMPYHTWPPFSAGDAFANRAAGLLAPLVRMKPGVTLDEARVELAGIAARLAQAYPDAGENRSATVQSFRDSVIGSSRQPILMLMGAVAFVLVIACANVANLLLSRAATRAREAATRLALGAGRARLASEFLAETGLIWFLGGALGLILGRYGLDVLVAASPGGLPGGLVPTLDPTVLGFTFALTVFTGVAFGLMPALRRSSRATFHDALKEGARAGAGAAGRTRSALVVAQIALTLVMLVGAGLMIRSLGELVRVNPGFSAANLLTMEYRLPANKYPDGPQQNAFHEAVVERVSAVPGVVSAAVTRALPFSGNGANGSIELPDQPPVAPDQRPRALLTAIGAGYLQTMGVPLVRGRYLERTDGADSPRVVVVNRRMAERFWPGQDPVGRVVRIVGNPSVEATIVGVVGDIQHYSLDDVERLQIYGPQSQNAHIFNTLVVRTAGDPMALATSVRAALWSVDKDQPVWKIRSLESLISGSTGFARFLMALMTTYAALALFLASVGIYGVMSYTVAHRTAEIGLRRALGAQTGDVLALIARDGVRLTSIGLALGVLGALGLGGFVRSQLFGVAPSDPGTFAAVVACLAAVAGIATWLPASRATRVDPLIALRHE